MLVWLGKTFNLSDWAEKHILCFYVKTAELEQVMSRYSY